MISNRNSQANIGRKADETFLTDGWKFRKAAVAVDLRYRCDYTAYGMLCTNRPRSWVKASRSCGESVR